jgi:hypothetical protein
MSLYSKFQNEAHFRREFIRPLLNRLGFHGVAEQHGTQEYGKDFVFSELHRLGGFRHYAAQVKHEETIHQGKAVDDLLSQVRQAFSRPFRRPDSPRECHVSSVYIFNSGSITPNAQEQLLSELQIDRYGDNAHFLDGARLESLNQWSFLQTDTVARARLLGLRATLRAIVWDLRENRAQGKEMLAPLYVRGLESYLGEPVNCDDQLLGSLHGLWLSLQAIETLRRMHTPTSKNAQELLPKIASLAQEVLPEAQEACRKVEAALERMKPLE